MRVVLVTRHSGTVAWLGRQGLRLPVVKHLAADMVGPGDVVLGNLPIHQAAEVVARGARYAGLCFDRPVETRGRELSADELAALGPRLVVFHVEALGPLDIAAVTGDDQAWYRGGGRSGR